MNGTRSPKLSVIIPIYNVEQYLEQCLNTVLAQTLKELEIICINDGSTDRSLEMVQQYASKFQQIVVLNQDNQGVSKARNRGIRAARGEYVVFMDPDDYYPDDDIFEYLYDHAKRNDALICGGSFSYDRDGKTITEFAGWFEHYIFKEHQKIAFENYQFPFGFHRYIYSLDLLRKNDIYFPDYSRCEDLVFVARAMVSASEFYAVPKTTYRYRKGYKPTILTAKRTADCTKGVLELLGISKRNGLSKLHEMAVAIIYDELYPAIFKHYKEGDADIHALLDQINDAIDTDLLGKEMNTLLKQQPLHPDDIRKYIKEITAKEKDFELLMQSYKQTVIYGAGVIGKKVAEFVETIHGTEMVCFAVTDKQGNPDNIGGIPVKTVAELISSKEQVMVLVATKAKFQLEIIDTLGSFHFRNVLPINFTEFRLFGIRPDKEIAV